MRSIKRVYATRIIALLIAVLVIAQVAGKYSDLRCYVQQQASKYQEVYEQGYATGDEIHDIVWNHTLVDFDLHIWRVRLDDLFHAVFTGGIRGEQVIAEIENPDYDSDCYGYIQWTIWDNRDYSSLDLPFRSSAIEAAHAITLALQDIPQEELRHYSVEAEDASYKLIWNESRGTTLNQYHNAGEVSAKDWLRGDIVPRNWAGWYADWLEQPDE